MCEKTNPGAGGCTAPACAVVLEVAKGVASSTTPAGAASAQPQPVEQALVSPTPPGRCRWQQAWPLLQHAHCAGDTHMAARGHAPSHNTSASPIVRRTLTRLGTVYPAGGATSYSLNSACTTSSSSECCRLKPSFSQMRIMSRLSGRMLAVRRASFSSAPTMAMRASSSLPRPRPCH